MTDVLMGRSARVPVSAREGEKDGESSNTHEWLDNLNIGKKRQYTNMYYDDDDA